MAFSDSASARSQRSGTVDGRVLPSAAVGDLLGREDELSWVAAALEVSRLVTLTGAPGIGKTRLALAVAERHREPAVVVELAPVADPAVVPASVACALSVREVPGRSLIETVVTTVHRRQLLLVLDNCEHLIGACAQLVDQLLDGCWLVRVLATSREPLGLPGERVWLVPPLAAPEQVHGDPEELMAYPAVALFVARAGEAQPGFALNPFVASDVAKVCRGLDGIPLAIELAAARVDVLTPGQIVRRLEDRLSLLRDHGGPPPVPRHRALATALDWSHALLSAPERVLLRRVSVFAGRFELDAAEAICAGEEVDPPGVSPLLGRLVSKSLLVADGDSRGQVRYRLLETIRAYAAEKLEQAGEVPDVRTAHAHFYATLAERAEVEFTGPRQEHWFERLEAEGANLRAALEWLLSRGQPGMALRMAGALVLFWRVRGHFTEGRELLGAALSASDGEAPVLTGRVLWGVGFLTLMAGDPKAAIASLEQSLACSQESGDGQGSARALLILANARQHYWDPSVVALVEESARIAREAGDWWCLAHALGVAGFECARHGELRPARRMFEECVTVARDAGEMQGLRFGLIGLGEVAISQGDYREAQSLFEEAVQITGALGEDYDTATALACLGELAFERGEYARAGELLDEAVALLPETAPVDARPAWLMALARVAHAQGDRARTRGLLEEAAALSFGIPLPQALGQLAVDEGDPGEGRRLFEEAYVLARATGLKASGADALHALGQLARDEGDPARAAALHDEALELRREGGELPRLADSFEAIAGLAADAGHHRHAARLLGAARALRDRGGYARVPWESARCEAVRQLVRGCLAPGELARALAAGEALSLEDAVAEASQGPELTRPANGRRSLTKRERQVVGLIADGLTNPEIADRLSISLTTVKTHVSHIFSKLGVAERSELAPMARFGNAR